MSLKIEIAEPGTCEWMRELRQCYPRQVCWRTTQFDRYIFKKHEVDWKWIISMLIKGSTKYSFAPKLTLVLLIWVLLMSKENTNILNVKVLLIIVLLIAFVAPLLESILFKKETISYDSEKINFDLKKYVGDIKIKNINAIYLNENVNHLTIETNDTKHFHKLYGFNRKIIQKMVDTINSCNKNNEI